MFELLENTTDEQTINELETELEYIKDALITHGIPTVEEYESDKTYWRQIIAEHHLSEEEEEAYMDRVENPRQNYSINNYWTIISIS